MASGWRVSGLRCRGERVAQVDGSGFLETVNPKNPKPCTLNHPNP